MALEIENNLVAALSGGGALPTVAAQFGIVDLTAPAAGVWEFETVESLGSGEVATACMIEDVGPAFVGLLQLAPNQWRVYAFDSIIDPAEVSWHVKIFRIATGV